MNHLKHLILLACFAGTATAQIPRFAPRRILRDAESHWRGRTGGLPMGVLLLGGLQPQYLQGIHICRLGSDHAASTRRRGGALPRVD